MDQLRAQASRASIIAIVALLLATTACGTSKSAAQVPVGGAVAITPDGQFLKADEQYGVPVRATSATTGTSDTSVCAPAGSLCLEP
jgi:hypothetical protein